MCIYSSIWILISSVILGITVGQSIDDSICTVKFSGTLECNTVNNCQGFQEAVNKNSIISFIKSATNCGFYKNIPKICCTPDIKKSTTVTQDTNDRYCGTTSRITGGMHAKINDSPWSARIATRNDDEDRNEFSCIGSLISETFVLTAANCVYESTVPGIRLGEFDTDALEDCVNGTVRHGTAFCTQPINVAVKKVIIHANFTGNPVDGNDIALLQLTRPVKYSEYVQPICLPKAVESSNEDYDASNVHTVNYTISGWGKTEFGFFSEVKRIVSLPSAELRLCVNTFQLNSDIKDNFICAGGVDGKDVCYGDGGAALAYLNKLSDQSFIYGIASAGPRYCGKPGRPGIYTRVTKYLDWIANSMATA